MLERRVLLRAVGGLSEEGGCSLLAVSPSVVKERGSLHSWGIVDSHALVTCQSCLLVSLTIAINCERVVAVCILLTSDSITSMSTALPCHNKAEYA